MKLSSGRIWKEALDTLCPQPPRIDANERAAQAAAAHAEIKKISEIKGVKNVSALLETARAVLAEEDGRKTGAETRATTLLAVMATLIPLLTWAVGTATPVCSPGLGCGAWSTAFILAVFYLMAAGFWSLRTFAVDNYHCLGVEEVRRISHDPEFELAIAKETLINARLNRGTINRKLDFIKCAQRSFYQALVLLALLLMCDPLARYQVLSTKKADVPSTSAPAPADVPTALPSIVTPRVLVPSPLTAPAQPAVPSPTPVANTPAEQRSEKETPSPRPQESERAERRK